MKVSKLHGARLDYWVAKAAGAESRINPNTQLCEVRVPGPPGKEEWTLYRPSEDWQDGGPIIEQGRIGVIPVGKGWEAYEQYPAVNGLGATALEAAMHSFVAARFGDEVPDDTGTQAK